MHKEVFLQTTASYSEMGLHLDSRTRKSSETSRELISVSTSFGRAMVSSRIPEADIEVWEAGMRHHANDHRYYELTHDALGHQFEHYYLVLKDHSGTTRAIQPFLIVNQDLVTGCLLYTSRCV